MLLETLNKIERVEPEPFLAPLLDVSITRLFSLQKGVPFWFETTMGPSHQGWWIMNPVSRDTIELGRPAQAIEYLEYLDQLPRFFVIALFSVGRESMMVIPYNEGDANQRGWLNGVPRIMHLTRGNIITPFSVVAAREIGSVLLYDSPSLGWPAQSEISSRLWEDFDADYDVPGNFKNARRIVRVEWQRREEARLKAEREAKLATVSGQIEHKLAIAGASLIDWQAHGGQEYKVTWEFEGREYTQIVTRELRIASAGICLAGGDRDQDLTSIVPVMQMERW